MDPQNHAQILHKGGTAEAPRAGEHMAGVDKAAGKVEERMAVGGKVGERKAGMDLVGVDMVVASAENHSQKDSSSLVKQKESESTFLFHFWLILVRVE